MCACVDVCIYIIDIHICISCTNLVGAVTHIHELRGHTEVAITRKAKGSLTSATAIVGLKAHVPFIAAGEASVGEAVEGADVENAGIAGRAGTGAAPRSKARSVSLAPARIGLGSKLGFMGSGSRVEG